MPAATAGGSSAANASARRATSSLTSAGPQTSNLTITARPGSATSVRHGAILTHGGADAIDLPQVQQVVAGVEAPQVLERLLAALGVHADAAQIVRRRLRHQPQVVAAEHLEHLERLGGIGVLVPQPQRPGVLIVAGERRTILAEDQP